MSRIGKWTLYFCGFAALLFVFLPPILRTEIGKRDNVTGGVKAFGPVFFDVQRRNDGAILWARPRLKLARN